MNPPAPLPAGFRLRFAAGVRRPAPGVLVGGAPLRVLRLTPPGADRVQRWMAGQPVGDGRSARVLAARLIEAGIATPVPPPSVTSPPAVAAVVPVRDDQAGLDTTLAALATVPGLRVRVVDDGSRPALTARGPGVGLHRHPEAEGPAAARNTGWREEAGEPGGGAEIIAFVDAGVVPAPSWLDLLLPHFADPAVAAVAPRIGTTIRAGTPPLLARFEVDHSPLDMGPDPAVVRPGSAVAYVPSTLLLIRRSDLEAAGGFDATMRFGEDVDLVWRLARAGRRVVYEPAASATHPARASWAAWLGQRFAYGTSAAGLAARHGTAVAPYSASPWSTAAWALLAGGHPVAAAGLTAASASVLARRAGTARADRPVAVHLAWLAAVGTLRSGPALASAVRRAWLPPAVMLGAAGWRGGGRPARLRIGAAALAVTAGSPLGLLSDLAYQAGVWTGAVRARSARSLLPRW